MKTKIRKILTALLVGFLVFVGLIIVGIGAITYLPGLDLNTWFVNTAIHWFLFRLCLYVVIGVLIYKIQRSSDRLPRKVGYLILLAIVLNEGLNILYRL